MAKAAYRAAQYAQSIILCEQLIAVKERLTDTELDEAYRVLVAAQEDAVEYDTGMETADRWLIDTRRANGRVDALLSQARMWDRKGELDRALELIDEANQAATINGYARGLATASRFRADILWERGDSEAGLVLLKQALATYERLRDMDGQILTLISIGIVHYLTGRLLGAIQTTLRAAHLCESVSDLAHVWIAYNNLGEYYQQTYAMEKALFYHEKARSIHPGPLDSDLIRNLGVDLVAVGRAEEGLVQLRQALIVAAQRGDKDNMLQVITSLADALYHTGEVAEARTLALQLLDEGRKLGSERHMLRASLILGYCAKSDGDSIAAQHYFQDGFMLAQQTGDKTMIWQTHAALAEMLAEEQPALAAVHQTIAADMLNSIALSIEDRELRDIFRNAPPIARVLHAISDEY